ncbi:DUF4190 domain-containing protein [Glycomyces paridis]|uniref:DUF4190 domain-containing protein n=1 Tax=Glycomyces paridis TaxID=2126555 RepID=A0A4S8PDP4_9ACTN|nr:DUF4190 domain-containing protein [Glycomyces paridis]THV28480.1 DUF4190 domain-containing protein [Glycomyces paridis]
MTTPDPSSDPAPDPAPGPPAYVPPPNPYAPYPPYGYGYGYAPARPTNGMAIAALVLGVVGVCNPISILGLVFGMIAKRQIQERGEQGEGMATAGIVLGWIGVASVVFWVLYIVFVVGVFTTAVNQIDVDEWPTEDPTWAIDLVTALFSAAA